MYLNNIYNIGIKDGFVAEFTPHSGAPRNDHEEKPVRLKD